MLTISFTKRVEPLTALAKARKFLFHSAAACSDLSSFNPVIGIKQIKFATATYQKSVD